MKAADVAGTAHTHGVLHFFGFPKTEADVTYTRHDPAGRTRRAVWALVACLALATLSILIPIAHFVLVPGFVLVGVFLFVKRLGEGSTLLAVAGVCPRCGEPREFDATGPLRPTTKVHCPVCQNAIDLVVDVVR